MLRPSTGERDQVLESLCRGRARGLVARGPGGLGAWGPGGLGSWRPGGQGAWRWAIHMGHVGGTQALAIWCIVGLGSGVHLEILPHCPLVRVSKVLLLPSLQLPWQIRYDERAESVL